MLPRPAAWGSEICSVVFSGFSLLAIVVLLAQYDGRPPFSWHGVNLNAVVSVLATAARGLLLLAVDEAVGQWKWVLFSRRRRLLDDFEVVDAASRGPLGSLKLLWKRKGSWEVRLGALVILLALVMDPFSQQLVQLRQAMSYTKDVSATIARATRYSQGNVFRQKFLSGPVETAFAYADLSMQSAILRSMSHSEDDIVQQLSYTCASGNCTWDSPIESLAVCHRCVDLASALETHEDSGTLWMSLLNEGIEYEPGITSRAYRLPNGLIIDNTDLWSFGNAKGEWPGTLVTTFGTGDPAQTNTMQDIDTLIWSTSILKVRRSSNDTTVWPSLPVQSMECALHYCINRHKSSVINGELYESTETLPYRRDPSSWSLADKNIKFELLNNLTAAQTNILVFNNYTSVLERTDLRLSTHGSYYNVSQMAVDSISSYLQDTFGRSLRGFTNETNSSAILPGRLNGYYIEDRGEVTFSSSLMQIIWSQDDIEELFAAMARGMSNVIRNGADAELEPTVTGSSGILVTLYKVQWGWMAIHFTVFMGGLVFVMMTVLQNRMHPSSARSPAWKNSALASLNFGLKLGNIFGHHESVREMKEVAARQEAKLLIKSAYAAGDEANDSLETIVDVHQ